jgi:hypothetical protein
MKNILTLAILILFAFSINAQNFSKQATDSKNKKTEQKADPNGPVIHFEKLTFDYGTITKGSDGTRLFKFTNTGKAPLKITRVKSTCGCTIPTYPKQEIMPGESAEVNVKYNTKKIGRFSKSVSIFTNTIPERTVLRIKGKVVDPNKPGPIRKEKNIMEVE